MKIRRKGEETIQVITPKQTYEPEVNMYEIELKEKSNLLVSFNYSFNWSEICFVDIPTPISNSSDSYVHTLVHLDKDNATKSSSFSCLPRSFFALGKKALYSSKGTKAILSNKIKDSVSNSVSDNFDLEIISCLLLENSSFNISGANNLSLLSNNRLIISPWEIKTLNNTLESNITSIYTSPLSFNFLCMDNLTLLDSSSASFAENLDFSTIDLNNINSKAFSAIAFLAISDQFISGIDSICSFNSLGIANVSVGILNPPAAHSAVNYVYPVQVFKSCGVREISDLSEPRKSPDFRGPKIPLGIFWHPENPNKTQGFLDLGLNTGLVSLDVGGRR